MPIDDKALAALERALDILGSLGAEYPDAREATKQVRLAFGAVQPETSGEAVVRCIKALAAKADPSDDKTADKKAVDALEAWTKGANVYDRSALREAIKPLLGRIADRAVMDASITACFGPFAFHTDLTVADIAVATRRFVADVRARWAKQI